MSRAEPKPESSMNMSWIPVFTGMTVKKENLPCQTLPRVIAFCAPQLLRQSRHQSPRFCRSILYLVHGYKNELILPVEINIV